MCSQFYFVKTKSNFQRGFEQHHILTSRWYFSCRAQGLVCNNTTALQLVGSKQEVSLAIIVLFSMKSGSFGPKKQQLEKWKTSSHPHLCREQPSRGTSGQQCMGLTCQESHCVENAAERKLKEAKEAKQPERKRKKESFDKCKYFSENLKDQNQAPMLG